MRRKPLTKEQCDLWLKIKHLAQQKADADGVFAMTYREVSRLAGSDKHGQLLLLPLLNAGLIVKQGMIEVKGCDEAPYRTSSIWRMTGSVPNAQASEPPDSLPSAPPKSQLWYALRQILVHWCYDERPLKEVAATVGYVWKLSYHSKPLGWFLSMSWKQLRKQLYIGPDKADMLLAIMYGLAERYNPDAVSEHPSCRRLAEQLNIVLPPDYRDAATWESAKKTLRQCGRISMTVSEFADAAGFQWPYDLHTLPLQDLLDLPWGSIRAKDKFGVQKQQALLTLVCRAADDIEAIKRGMYRKSPPTSVIETRLHALGLDSATPVDILFFSRLAREHLLSKGLNNLGAILSYLAGADCMSLMKTANVGVKTARELLRLSQGVQELNLKNLRRCIPLGPEGKGISYAAYARLWLNEIPANQRDWLFHHYGLGESQIEVAQQQGVTVGALTRPRVLLCQALEKGLSYFPDESRRIRKAWARGEPIASAISWDMDETDCATVCGVLDRVLRVSAAKKAKAENQSVLFRSWWRRLLRLPAFTREGVNLTHFLLDLGHPELKPQFIEYLGRKTSAFVCSITGNAYHISTVNQPSLPELDQE